MRVIYKGVVHGKRFFLWQPVRSSTSTLLASLWVHSSTGSTWKSSWRLFVFVCTTGLMEPEKKIMFLDRGGPGWGLQPLIVPLPPSLITASSFFLVLIRSPTSAGRRGAVAAEVMNALATWWRRNNERNVNNHWTRSLDPSFHTWSLWLLRRDKLCNIVCFSPDAPLTCSEAFTFIFYKRDGKFCSRGAVEIKDVRTVVTLLIIQVNCEQSAQYF